MRTDLKLKIPQAILKGVTLSLNQEERESLLTICRTSLRNPDAEENLLTVLFIKAIFNLRKETCFPVEINHQLNNILPGEDIRKLFFKEFAPIQWLTDRTRNLIKPAMTAETITVIDFADRSHTLTGQLLSTARPYSKIRFIPVGPCADKIPPHMKNSFPPGTSITPLVKPLSRLTSDDWHYIKNRADGITVCTSFLTLHHLEKDSIQAGIPSNQIQMIPDFLKSLANLSPDYLLVAEPYGKHSTPDCVTRIGNAWDHFLGLFRLISKNRYLTTGQKQAIMMMFQDEILDIAGTPIPLEERHRPLEWWINHFSTCGLMIRPPLDINRDTAIMNTPGLIEKRKSGALFLEYESTPLLSLIHASGSEIFK